MNEIKLITAGASLSWIGILLILTVPTLTIWTVCELVALARHRRRQIAARNRAMIESVNRQQRLPTPRISLTGSPKMLPAPVVRRRDKHPIHVRTRVRWVKEWQRYERFSVVDMRKKEDEE